REVALFKGNPRRLRSASLVSNVEGRFWHLANCERNELDGPACLGQIGCLGFDGIYDRRGDGFAAQKVVASLSGNGNCGKCHQATVQIEESAARSSFGTVRTLGNDLPSPGGAGSFRIARML